MMPRPLHVVEHAMEAQVCLRALRKAAAPLWESAIASGDWTLMAECKALSTTFSIASVQLRRMTKRADELCPDGLLEPGHGAAA